MNKINLPQNSSPHFGEFKFGLLAQNPALEILKSIDFSWQSPKAPNPYIGQEKYTYHRNWCKKGPTGFEPVTS